MEIFLQLKMKTETYPKIGNKEGSFITSEGKNPKIKSDIPL